MATLVFDIETVGKSWDLFDETVKRSLLKHTTSLDEETRVQNRLSLSPFTGEIVSLSVYDVERKSGIVYASGIGESYREGDFSHHPRTEREMLEDFWEGAIQYDTFVTYNGRVFDVPFLMMRSAMYGIRPSVALAGRRFLLNQREIFHVDIFDQFTWYGAFQRWPSLRVACDAFGVVYGNSEAGGEDIAELFRKKKFRDIARHAMSDTIATHALYEKWLAYLAPLEFIERYERMS